MKENANTPTVTAKIIWMNEDKSSAKKATATVTIADSFQINGVSIIEGSKGIFVSMPQRSITDKNGVKKYVDVAHPVTSEMRNAIHSAVLGAYSMKRALANPCQKRLQKNSDTEEPTPIQSKEVVDDETAEESTEPDDAEDESEEGQDDSLAPIMGQLA